MGYLIGERPTNEIPGINLDSYYTLSGSTVIHGRVFLLVFADPINNAATYVSYLQNVQTVVNAYPSGDITAIGVLYQFNGEIDGVDFLSYSDTLQTAGVNFTLVNNGAWAGSAAYNYHLYDIATFPFIYLISKLYLIADKNPASLSSAVATLMAGPAITTIVPATADPYHALSTIGLTFAEAVLNATTASNYTLGGAGRGSIPVNPTSAVLDGVVANKYNLTLGAGTPGDGALSITLSNITDTVFYSPAPVSDPVINYNMDITPPSIGLSQSPSTSTNTDVTITATITDTGSGVAVQKYASGSQTIAWFAANGAVLPGTTFVVGVNDTYTVYAKDNAGNERVQTINITNIDKVAPAIPADSAITPNLNTSLVLNASSAGTATITGIVEANATVELIVAGSASGVIVTANGSGTFTFSNANLISAGIAGLNAVVADYSTAKAVALKISDAAGNSVTTPHVISYTKDTLAPAAPTHLHVIPNLNTAVLLNAATDDTATIAGVAGAVEANTTVTLVIDDVETIHSTTADGSGAFTFDNTVLKNALLASGSDYTAPKVAKLKVSDAASNSVITTEGISYTKDTILPVSAATYPKADTATTVGFTVRTQINETGSAYFVVVADGAAAPSSTQVKAGQNASGAAAITSGTIALAANVEGSLVVTGLSANTNYDVYVAADDAAGNLQTSPVKLDIQTTLGAPVDVYVRDSLSDTGAEPSGGGCSSPDIIVSPTIELTPNTAFPNVSLDYGTTNIEIGNDNYIYIRVLNRSSVASDVTAKLYYAYLGTTCAPDQWTLIQDNIPINGVPALGFKISDTITWNAPDPGALGYDHFCLIAMVSNSTESYPDNSGITDASSYIQFIQMHNNVAYKNLVFQNLVDDSKKSKSFTIRGFGKLFTSDLIINAQPLGKMGTVAVKIPKAMLAAGHPEIVDMKPIPWIISEKSLVGDQALYQWYAVTPGKAGMIKNFVMVPRQIHFDCVIEVYLNPKVNGGRYTVPVLHRFMNKTMGAVNIILNVIPLEKAKYIGLSSTHLIHKNGCKTLVGADRNDMVPYNSLIEARTDGFDLALDCLNVPFTIKDVSGHIRLKILAYLNGIKDHRELQKKILDTPGIGYKNGHYGIAEKKGIGLTETGALEILQRRNSLGKFTRLEQVDAIKGIGKDTLIDIVNSFKTSEIVAKSPATTQKKPVLKRMTDMVKKAFAPKPVKVKKKVTDAKPVKAIHESPKSPLAKKPSPEKAKTAVVKKVKTPAKRTKAKSVRATHEPLAKKTPVIKKPVKATAKKPVASKPLKATKPVKKTTVRSIHELTKAKKTVKPVKKAAKKIVARVKVIHESPRAKKPVAKKARKPVRTSTKKAVKKTAAKKKK